VIAGTAGALFVPQVGIINPSEFAPANSIEVVIWTAVGGRGTLIGPIIGGLLVNAGKTVFTSLWPDYWLYALGALFILVTLFLPKGVVGTLRDVFGRRVPPRGDNTEPEETGQTDRPMVGEPTPAPGPAE
jgi:urea transport system permease protein